MKYFFYIYLRIFKCFNCWNWWKYIDKPYRNRNIMKNVWKLCEKVGKSWCKKKWRRSKFEGGKMPKSLDEKESLPLPYNWEKRQDYDGKTYFIDHTKKITTWIDPRDRQVYLTSIINCIERWKNCTKLRWKVDENCIKTCKVHVFSDQTRVWPSILKKISH